MVAAFESAASRRAESALGGCNVSSCSGSWCCSADWHATLAETASRSAWRSWMACSMMVSARTSAGTVGAHRRTHWRKVLGLIP
jgi:hypothetical protein